MPTPQTPSALDALESVALIRNTPGDRASVWPAKGYPSLFGVPRFLAIHKVQGKANPLSKEVMA
jgi:hypothetical protein